MTTFTQKLITCIALTLSVSCADTNDDINSVAENCCATENHRQGTLSAGALQLAKAFDSETSPPVLLVKDQPALESPIANIARSQTILSSVVTAPVRPKKDKYTHGVAYGKVRVIKGDSELVELTDDGELPQIGDVVLNIFPVLDDEDVVLLDDELDTVFSYIHAEPLHRLKVTEDGAFKVSLEPGKYSIFATVKLSDDDGSSVEAHFCNIESRDGSLCEVSIEAGHANRIDLNIQ